MEKTLSVQHNANLPKGYASTQNTLDRYQSLVSLMSNQGLHQEILKILRRPVEVVVIATMSAGKSTLLNAMIGYELLPSSNEASTSRVFRVENRDDQETFMARFNGEETTSDWEEANPELLKRLNQLQQPGIIEICGNIRTIDNLGAHLVIYDTPGPNNSRDRAHAKITHTVLHDGHYGLVIYIINATQIGINDDALLLRELNKVANCQTDHKQVIFVVNKADAIDEDRGEVLSVIVAQIRDYLEQYGFVNPIIVPVCAEGALLARKMQSGNTLTRKERSTLDALFASYRQNAKLFLQAAAVSVTLKHQVKQLLVQHSNSGSNVAKNIITKNELERFIAFTGVKTIELILQKILVEEGLPATMRELKACLRDYGLHAMDEWIDIPPMPCVYLSHDPFSRHSVVSIDGEFLEDHSSLIENIHTQHLPKWAEDFFDMLFVHMHYPTHIKFIFQGLRPDFDTLQTVARKAENKWGIRIYSSYIPRVNLAQRLRNLKHLVENEEVSQW